MSASSKQRKKRLRRESRTIIILGDADEIAAKGYNLEGATIIDPATSDKQEEFAELLYELRKAKGMTPEEAKELVKDPIHFAVLW